MKFDDEGRLKVYVEGVTKTPLETQNSGSTIASDTSLLNFVGFNISTPSLNNVRIEPLTSGSVGYLFEAYQTASQNILGAPSSSQINFHQTRFLNSLYTLSSSKDAIIFNSDGVYQINYRISMDNTNDNKAQSFSLLTLNDEQISGSFSYGFDINSGQGESTCIGFCYLQIQQNDILKVISQKQSGGGNLVTIPNGTNILITKWV